MPSRSTLYHSAKANAINKPWDRRCNSNKGNDRFILSKVSGNRPARMHRRDYNLACTDFRQIIMDAVEYTTKERQQLVINQLKTRTTMITATSPEPTLQHPLKKSDYFSRNLGQSSEEETVTVRQDTCIPMSSLQTSDFGGGRKYSTHS